MQNITYCQKHNELCIFFDQQSNGFCRYCAQEKMGNVLSIEQFQEKQIALNIQIEQERNQNIQNLSQVIDSLNSIKDKVKVKIDKIVQNVQEQISFCQNILINSNIQQQQQQQNSFSTKEQNEKFNKQLILQLNELQSIISIDQLLKLINNNSNSSINIEQQNIQQDNYKISSIVNVSFRKNHFFKLQIEKQFKQCQAFAFNNDNSYLIIAQDKIIIVNEFYKNSLNFKEQQRLTNHKGNVNCLHHMQQQDQFLSGSDDGQIIIWKKDFTNQYKVQQCLLGHQHQIYCLIMNHSENLIISGNSDEQLKFWKLEDEIWINHQILNIPQIPNSLSINLSQTKIIASIWNNNILIIEKKINEQWDIVQKIEIDDFGYRLNFITDDQFIYQQKTADQLSIYNYDIKKQQFCLSKKVQVQISNSFENYFPSQYIKSKNLLLVKHGKYINIIQINENLDYRVDQTLDFGIDNLFGCLSYDGSFLITWDSKSNNIQIRNYESIL